MLKMKIVCEPVTDWDNTYKMYRAKDEVTGLEAYGVTHEQAISNVLGLLQVNQWEWEALLKTG